MKNDKMTQLRLPLSLIGLTPYPHQCLALKELGFLFETRFLWVKNELVTEGGEEIFNLIERRFVHKFDKESHYSILPAPIIEEIAPLISMQYSVMFTKHSYIFLNLTESIVKETKSEDEKVISKSVVYVRIKEADDKTAIGCWAKGLIYLLTNKKLILKKDEKKEN